MLLHHIKFFQKAEYLRIYAQELARQLIYTHQAIPSDWYCVPGSQAGLRQRGFNQTHVFAKLLRSELQREIQREHHATSSICIHTLTLSTFGKQLNTQQHQQRAKQRRLRSQRDYLVPNKPTGTVLLIDDIITSGATISACSQALLFAGADAVIVWALARTPR